MQEETINLFLDGMSVESLIQVRSECTKRINGIIKSVTASIDAHCQIGNVRVIRFHNNSVRVCANGVPPTDIFFQAYNYWNAETYESDGIDSDAFIVHTKICNCTVKKSSFESVDDITFAGYDQPVIDAVKDKLRLMIKLSTIERALS